MPNGRLLPSISGLEDVPEAEAANVTIVRAVSDLKNVFILFDLL